MGKTVLLHEFARVAGRRGFTHEHIEMAPDGALGLRLAVALRKAVLKLGGRKKAKGADRRALGVLKAFVLTLPDGASVPIEADAAPGTADSGHLASDLGALFEEVGLAARAHECGIFLTVDEMHHLPPSGLEALLAGLHRAHRLGLPLVLVGRRPALAGGRERAKRGTALEQMFRFAPARSAGPRRRSATAVQAPAAAEGVGWKGRRRGPDVRGDQGYPSFIQELGKQAWDLAEEGSKAIRRRRCGARHPPGHWPSSMRASSGSARAGRRFPSAPICGPWRNWARAS